MLVYISCNPGSLSTPFIEREQNIEEHLVVVRKSFKGTGSLESDRVVVKDLSPNLLAVIGSVMAQSVALVRILSDVHFFVHL